MKAHLENSMGIMIQEPGAKNLTKQTMNNAIENPSETAVLSLIDVFRPLLPADHRVTSVVETKKAEYTID
ncbi:hypothetical protein P7G51_09880 [Enterococcus asini]|uniref:hypothetical protein n=1 Tax=Enterococcus TaxID=1350 RepID=UPI0028913723|nr:hypothetical protein [Enterococcus asini]MDT2757687.1 hypothetical protein [Enterococcus asini]